MKWGKHYIEPHFGMGLLLGTLAGLVLNGSPLGNIFLLILCGWLIFALLGSRFAQKSNSKHNPEG